MPVSRASVSLPSPETGPARRLLWRLAAALGLAALVTLVAYFGRDGYRDSAGGDIGLLDALYYATVSITTTGYGDIVPVSDAARLATTLIVTPARVIFLIILVGTTIEVLTERTRTAVRERLWRQGLKDHTIVCGFGTKGQTAIQTLLANGTRRDRVIVIDDDRECVDDASRAGFAAIFGSAGRVNVLEEAEVASAEAVIVAVDRDDTAVLVTLTSRELNKSATIVASAREAENVHLLRQSGADSVILTSGAAGQLLGQAVQSPSVVEVLEDLLAVGKGLDIVERDVREPEIGRSLAELDTPEPAIAFVRDGAMLPFDDAGATELQAGDRVISLRSKGS